MDWSKHPLMYVLEGKEPRPARNIREFGVFMSQREKNIVAQSTIRGFLISTVFLGVDHGFGRGVPVLFETMIFAQEAKSDPFEFQRRYSTWAEAESGHIEAIEALADFLARLDALVREEAKAEIQRIKEKAWH